MADSFNNPPQPTPSHGPNSQIFPPDNPSSNAPAHDDGDNTHVPRPKRIACVVCRRRKLKCDGKRPSCGTCSRLGHECAYDEVRKKSGPKRGYVKQLEARLAQVETLLKGDDKPTARTSSVQQQENGFNAPAPNGPTPTMLDIPTLSSDMDSTMPPFPETATQSLSNDPFVPQFRPNIWSGTEWNMIDLGLEEPLPTRDVIDELERDYFEKVHSTMPIIHRPRYFAAMDLAPHARPPIYLRYIMWCHAAVLSDKYTDLHPHFYQRARKYAELEEMKPHGGNMVSLAYCQTWVLMCMYEHRMVYFPRAWLSVGKAIRLALMLGFNRLDGAGLDVKLCFPPPRDWTDREERCRTFWACFCADRYASVGTGWPLMIDEKDIMTNLPATEEAFIKGRPQKTSRLSDLMSGDGIPTLSSFGSIALLTCFFGRELLHIHRPDPHGNDNDLNGGFWRRHRAYDNLLLNAALSAPNHLRLPTGIADRNVIFWNMGIHAATICLHKAAIFAAEKNKLPNPIVAESKRRCIVAADQITSIMKMISHLDLSTMNPFMSFSVFIAGCVFIQYLKARPDDSAVQSSLQFIVSALRAFTVKNPLSKSFLDQLEKDLDGIGFCSSSSNSRYTRTTPSDVQDSFECAAPLFNIRQSQADSTVENPSQAVPPAAHPSICRPNFHGATSLPSRHKSKAEQQSTPNTIFGGDLQSSTGFPNDEAGGQAGLDVDFSSDFNISEKAGPPSDHPTPSTLNSSNTSYSLSRGDQPSPPKSQQQPFSINHPQGPISSLNGVNELDMLPEITGTSQFEDVSSLPSQLFASNPEVQIGSTVPESPFNLPSTWNLGDMQSANPGSTGASPSGMGAFDEIQWAQLLNGANWGGWGT